MRGDEQAPAGHCAGELGVDAPRDPAAGGLRRPERVRRVVRPVQAGAAHGEVSAPLEQSPWRRTWRTSNSAAAAPWRWTLRAPARQREGAAPTGDEKMLLLP